MHIKWRILRSSCCHWNNSYCAGCGGHCIRSLHKVSRVKGGQQRSTYKKVIIVIIKSPNFRRYKSLHEKNAAADSTSPTSGIRSSGVPIPYFPSPASRYVTDTRFDDPSEPIYTDPSLFERSRSSRGTTLAEHFEKHGKSNRGFEPDEEHP